MNTNDLSEITIENVKKLALKASYIDNDLILFEKFGDLPIPNEPRRTRCLIIALCLQGKAQYSVDTKKHEMGPNDFILINEGQVTNDCLLSRDCNGIALMISQDFFHEIIKNVHELSSLFLFSRMHPVCKMEPNEVEMICSYFRLLKKKVDDHDHHFRKETAQALLTTVIYDLSNVIYRIQNTYDKRPTRSELIFTQFIKLVEANFRHERRVGWYSHELSISAKYLSECVKQVSQRTPNDWINNYVTLELRVLLKNSTKSIKEIADELHFPNQSFLGKFFKEHTGIPPSRYRRS